MNVNIMIFCHAKMKFSCENSLANVGTLQIVTDLINLIKEIIQIVINTWLTKLWNFWTYSGLFSFFWNINQGNLPQFIPKHEKGIKESCWDSFSIGITQVLEKIEILVIFYNECQRIRLYSFNSSV